MLFDSYVRFHSFSKVVVTEWPHIGKSLLTRHVVCFLGVVAWLSVFFSHHGFCSGSCCCAFS